MQGRPGLSPVHVEATYTVPDAHFEQLRAISDGLGLEAEKARRERLGKSTPGEAEDEVALLDVTGGALTFRPGADYGVDLTMDDADVDAVTQQVSAAARQADWVIASLHGHQGPAGRSLAHESPACHERFARRCIEAGADVFVGHGPHVLRGIELHEGAPIFYSLGDFVLQNETIPRLPPSIYDRYDLGPDAVPADAIDARFFVDRDDDEGFLRDRAYWESVLPVCQWDGGTLDRIDLLPLDLGGDAPRPQRGRPLRATDETAARILSDLQDYSATEGTEIEVVGEKGVVRP